MALSNLERIGAALELLNTGLKPFVERELQAVYRDRWITEIQSLLHDDQKPGKKTKGLHWDTQALLVVMWDQWNAVFKNILGQAERSLVSELRDVRNRWAHQKAFTTEDAYRALDSMVRLLTAVSAPEAEEVDRHRQELMRLRYEEQVRRESRRAAVTPVEGKPAAGLKAWRDVTTPHPDVATGRYQQAEFAADLWQVYLKEGTDEYRDPHEFFRRTFLTEGLRKLLSSALLRLSGQGGDPVIELQTNFGGGKTHSMLALFHLFCGTPAGNLPGLEAVVREAGVSQPPEVRRAVLVGTKTSPGQPQRKSDGTVVRTLWGELAWQLGGKEGYRLVKEADETSTSPGDALRLLFNRYAPCLILIDEWVAYARQLYGHGSELPAGSFDTQFSFAQALSEAAKAAPKTMLVVSIPASDNEIGGEGGRAALDRLKNTIGRVESPWRPAGAEESFEIVRRRLFQPITDPELFVARDAVVRAFGDLYRTQHQEFPSECRDADYERRLRLAYPIHPELFDRLYTDWSSLDKFQRTRGVLRLMAAVIHTLWERQDRNLLILPASVPIDEAAVQAELTRYLPPTWTPVIEKDVDGSNSLPLKLDRENPNLGRYSACRRVSRTLYLGSAPTLDAAHRGLEDRQITLGCVQPGENVGTFGDALRRLTDQATHLYVDGKRYWYSTQPSVNRLAEERAERYDADTVNEEIRRRLREQARSRGDFARIHDCPASSGDVPDDPEARLVIVGPEQTHSAKAADSPARQAAAEILKNRGTSPRNYANTLLFLAADRARLADLDKAVRQYLAWTSIVNEQDTLNLDAFQSKQAKTKRDHANDAIDARIPEAYCWLLVPTQPDPQGDLVWQEIRQQGAEALATRASRKLRNDGLLLTKFAGVLLRTELDKVPLWRGSHVSLKQLADDFARYIYLPRLRDQDVLVDAAQEGVALLTWQPEAFAYADGWDETAGRYRGLRAGQHVRIAVSADSILVKPDAAIQQMQAEAPAPEPVPETGPSVPGGTPGVGAQPSPVGPTPPGPEPKTPQPTRFYGSVRLDATRLSRDAGKIAEEVVQHLTARPGATVEVTLEVQVVIPDGAPDELMRTVTENCRTLKFTSYGFEKE